jgi:hypothetical protein
MRADFRDIASQLPAQLGTCRDNSRHCHGSDSANDKRLPLKSSVEELCNVGERAGERYSRRVKTDTETPHEPVGPKARISFAVALKDIGVSAFRLNADRAPVQS